MSGAPYGMPSSGSFTLEELPRVDTTKLQDDEVAQIERTIIESQDRIAELSVERLELRTERDAFERRVSELQERINQLERDRPSLEPRQVLTDFGEAISGVDEDLEAEAGGYAISDLEVDLKANVVRTSEGLRVHLPTLDEEFASENLSNLRFRVSRRPEESETTLEEVPDVRYLDETTARERVQRAGFDVTVEYEATPDEEPGVVLAQFPSPYSLTDPTTDVLLTVSTEEGNENEQAIEETALDASTEPSEADAGETSETWEEDADDPAESEAEGEASTTGEEAEAEHERPASDGEIRPEVVSGIGPTYAERLHEADVATVEEMATLEPAELAAIIDTSEERAERFLDRGREHLRARELATDEERPAPVIEDVSGVEPATAERLRDAGFSTVETVAATEPERLAASTDLSVEDAERIVDRSLEHLRAWTPGAASDLGPEALATAESAEVERLRDAGFSTVEMVASAEPERIAETTDLAVDRAAKLRMGGFAHVLARPEERDLPDLEDVSGIGPTYARRLRNAGVEDIAELARLPAETAASITGTSPSRAAPWIAQSREMLVGRI